MKIFFIAPYLGKQKYQKDYDKIIALIESTGAEVISAEKSQEYQDSFAEANIKKYGSRERVHYEFIRQGVLRADGLVVEASFNDLRVGHEMTLALLYKKPVLCLSQNLDYGKYIEHEYFRAYLYSQKNLKEITLKWLSSVSDRIKARRSLGYRVTERKWGTQKTGAQKQIAVLGAVNIDMVTKVSMIPKVDEVVISEGLKLVPGGKATNAAIGMSRLGEKIWMLGKIGNDFFGESLRDIFKREEIDAQSVVTDSFIPTGTTMINVDSRGKNTIIVNEDANIKINQQAIKDFLRQVDEGKIIIDCFYITLEPLPEIVAYAIKEFYKRKITIFCDAAPTSRPLNRKLYPFIDFLSCNELEAEAMTGVKVVDEKNAELAAQKLKQSGAKTIIVTLGEMGSVLLADKAKYYPGLKVMTVDETGAGDAFRAGFVTEYLETKDLDKAMLMGNKVGAFTVTRLGVYEALPTRDDLGFFRPVE